MRLCATYMPVPLAQFPQIIRSGRNPGPFDAFPSAPRVRTALLVNTSVGLRQVSSILSINPISVDVKKKGCHQIYLT